MATITVLKFWTGVEKGPDGEMRPVDWVRWRPPLIDGQPSKSANEEKVRRLNPANIRVPEGSEAGEKMERLEAIWSIIGPAYESWKEGQGIPENGTPLGVWPAIDSDMGDVLRSAGYKTVESIAELKDYEAIKLPVGNGRELAKLAQMFLESRDTAERDAREQEKDNRIAALEERLHKFEQDGGADTEHEADDEVSRLRAQLDEMEVAYDRRWGAQRLREALESVTEAA